MKIETKVYKEKKSEWKDKKIKLFDFRNNNNDSKTYNIHESRNNEDKPRVLDFT